MALRRASRLLWSVLPLRLRRRLLVAATGPLAPRVAANCPAAEPLCLAGLLSSAVGIGEGARLSLEAFRRLGYDVTGFDLSGAFGQRDLFDLPAVSPPVPGPGTIVIHLNPEQLPLGLMTLGRGLLTGKHIVGYWSWELPRMPDTWRGGFRFVDEIWTPSRFVADAIRPFTAKPVRVLPHPAAIGRRGRHRPQDFALPEGRFTVLAMLRMGSSFARKNPLAAIAAFRAAFGDDPRALLLLKVADGWSEPALMRQLMQAVAGAANIRLTEEAFGAQEMLDLIASVDAVLSLHRSEGFGLVLAEAMLAETAVIATGWSGNLDFMSAESAALIDYDPVPVTDPQGCYVADGQGWAEPSVAQASAALSRLAADRDELRSLAVQGRAHAEAVLGLDAYRTALAPFFPPPRAS